MVYHNIYQKKIKTSKTACFDEKLKTTKDAETVFAHGIPSQNTVKSLVVSLIFPFRPDMNNTPFDETFKIKNI